MKKRQLKEFERLLDNCDFYYGKNDVVRFTNEVGALRGFTYALKDDWSAYVDKHDLDRFNHYISITCNYMNKNDEYLKFVSEFLCIKSE